MKIPSSEFWFYIGAMLSEASDLAAICRSIKGVHAKEMQFKADYIHKKLMEIANSMNKEERMIDGCN